MGKGGKHQWYVFPFQEWVFSFINVYIYRVNTNLRCLQRECPKMQGTETDAENEMIGDDLKHRAVTWYLLLLLLLEMVLSKGRYPLCLHRASSRPTLDKFTFPSATAEQTGNIHTLLVGTSMNRMNSANHIVTLLPCHLQSLATCALWAKQLKIITMAANRQDRLSSEYSPVDVRLRAGPLQICTISFISHFFFTVRRFSLANNFPPLTNALHITTLSCPLLYPH